MSTSTVYVGRKKTRLIKFPSIKEAIQYIKQKRKSMGISLQIILP